MTTNYQTDSSTSNSIVESKKQGIQNEQSVHTDTKTRPDLTHGKGDVQEHNALGAKNVMARPFVPHELKQIASKPVSRILTAQSPPGDPNMAQNYYCQLLQDPHTCLCSDTSHFKNYPWLNLPKLNWNASASLSSLASQARNPASSHSSTYSSIEHAKDRSEYVKIFKTLLAEEFSQHAILYQGYSQYQLQPQQIKPHFSSLNITENSSMSDSSNNTTSRSRAVIEIDGIHDARPQLQPGDHVILRPHQQVPLSPATLGGTQPYRPHHQSYQTVEIQARVITTTRGRRATKAGEAIIGRRGNGDSVVITWLTKEQSDFVMNVPMVVQFFPSAACADRCLAALEWVEQLDPTSARALLFPTKYSEIKRHNTRQDKEVATLVGEKCKIYDPDLTALNDEQSKFVRLVLERSANPSSETVRPPTVLTGPAGTGKTRTLLAGLLKTLQFFNKRECSETGTLALTLQPFTRRVLVCTPSHTACDVITRRLGKNLSRKELFRFYDPKRPLEMIPAEMFQYTRQGDMGEFILPPMTEFMNFQVVVCTCSDAHLLYLAGITNSSLRARRSCLQRFIESKIEIANGLHLEGAIRGAETPHFTHLFIDEAAQATEPETLIPLSVVVDDTAGVTKVEIAMAGDPRQLSPLIYSQFAKPVLAKSMLERLLRLPDLGGRDHLLGPPTKESWANMDELVEYSFQNDALSLGQHLSTFLRLSYRGHPAFLDMPNKLFYFEKLKSTKPDVVNEPWLTVIKQLKSCPELKPESSPDGEKKCLWPIHFRGITGGRDCSASVTGVSGSNSWFNNAEAVSVTNIVVLLFKKGIPTEDIGVMAAFRAQAVQIRKLLRSKSLGSVNVGTVEDYQAVERKVIVLSLTRSNEAFLAADIENGEGLFHQPKRMNVALTRAESLLVVVGNPYIMGKDSFWSKWLEFCRAHGLWYNELPCGAESTQPDSTMIKSVI